MRILLLLLFLTLPVLAQPWTTVPMLVVPGQSLGPIELGKPIPPKAYQLLGSSSGRQLAESKDNGGEDWRAPEDVYINVKLHDGGRPDNVYQIFWTVSGPKTADGLGVGSPMEAVVRKFPQGQWDVNAMEETPCWRTPGLTFTCDSRQGKVILMHLYPLKYP